MQSRKSSRSGQEELNRRRCEFLLSWSPEASWVFGLMNGNGHVSSGGFIQFCCPEKSTVQKWNALMFVEKEPKFARGVWLTYLHSVDVAKIFRGEGMGPRKKEELCIPKSLPQERLWHYLRGLLEMDGIFVKSDPKYARISKRGRKSFSIGFSSANSGFCSEVLAAIGGGVSITHSTKELNGKEFESWRFKFGFERSVSILMAMYQDSRDEIRCSRRYEQAKRAIEIWDSYQQPCIDCGEKKRVTETRCLKCHHKWVFGDNPKPVCAFDGCDSESSLGGFCTKHYHRNMRKRKKEAAGEIYKPRREYREDAFGDLLKSLNRSDVETVSLDWDDAIHVCINIDGHDVLMDRSDLKLLGDWTWRVNKDGYLVRKTKGKMIRIHRIICGTPDALDTDHINGNKLDNRRCNLRDVTNQQNQFNRSNRSGSKGVTRFGNQWRAVITYNGDRISLGYFKTQEEAQAAYDAAALKLWGSLARPVDSVQDLSLPVIESSESSKRKPRSDKIDRGVCWRCCKKQASMAWKHGDDPNMQVCQGCFAWLYRRHRAKKDGKSVKVRCSPFIGGDGKCRWEHGECGKDADIGCRGFCYTHNRADRKIQSGESIESVNEWVLKNKRRGRPRSKT